MALPTTLFSERIVNEQKFDENFILNTISENPKTSILIRVGEKDKSAVKDCVEKYGNAIWRISRKFANSPGEAEKLTYEIFSDLWENIENFDCNKYSDDHFIMMIALKHINKFKKI